MASRQESKAEKAAEALKEAAEYARMRREGKSIETIAKHFSVPGQTVTGQTVRDRIRLHEVSPRIKAACLNALPELGVSLTVQLLRHYHREHGHFRELIRGVLKPNGGIDEAGRERCKVAAGVRGKKARWQYVRERDANRRRRS